MVVVTVVPVVLVVFMAVVRKFFFVMGMLRMMMFALVACASLVHLVVATRILPSSLLDDFICHHFSSGIHGGEGFLDAVTVQLERKSGPGIFNGDAVEMG